MSMTDANTTAIVDSEAHKVMSRTYQAEVKCVEWLHAGLVIAAEHMYVAHLHGIVYLHDVALSKPLAHTQPVS